MISNRLCRDVVITIAVYGGIYLLCLYVFHLSGVYDSTGNLINDYSVQIVTCVLSVWAVLSGRKNTNIFLMAGTVLGLITGNIAGEIMKRKSVLGFNNGWVFYISVLFIFCVTGYLVDIRDQYKKKQQVKGGIKAMRVAFVVIVLLLSVITWFDAKLSLGHQRGAEEGYTEGYELGVSDARNGRRKRIRPPNHKYTAGDFEYAGYMFYSESGYRKGYEGEAK